MKRILVAVIGAWLMAGTAGTVAQDVPLCDDVVEGMCRASIEAWEIPGEDDDSWRHWCYIIVPFDEYEPMWATARHKNKGIVDYSFECVDGLVHRELRFQMGDQRFKEGRVRRGKWHGWVDYDVRYGPCDARILYADGVEKRRVVSEPEGCFE